MKKIRISVFIFVWGLLAGVSGYAFTSLSREGSRSISSGDTTIDVSFLQFNIWQEGTSVPHGFTYIKDIILATNADIVSFIEVRNYDGDWTSRMVDSLAAAGVNYYRGYLNGADVSVISKYPIVDAGPLAGNAVSFFEVDAGGIRFVVASAHLDYTHYACYLPRGYNCGGDAPYSGWSQIGSPDPQPVTDVGVIAAQNLGSQRDEQINAFLKECKNRKLPVILLGDFNEPSWLDWTDKQASLFDHHGVVYAWNTTRTLADSGFTDSFREIFPEEVDNPGFTWPAVATGVGSTSWAPKADERDRIDFIFYRGERVQTLSAAIVGPKEAYVRNVPSDANTDKEVFLADSLPWPSDHKGVYAVLRIPYVEYEETLSDTLLPNTQEVPEGTDLFVWYEVNEYAQGDKIALFTEGEGPAGMPVFSQTLPADSGTVTVSGLTAGDYDLYLLTADDQVKTGPKKISVKDNTHDAINATRFVFELGKTYSFYYNSVHYTAKDWIGIYPMDREVISGGNPGYSSDWVYIPSASDTIEMLNEHYTISTPGWYKAYLFANDSYTILSGPVYFYITDEEITRAGNISTAGNLKVYPNPARERITIHVPAGDVIRRIVLYNTGGQEVLRREYNGGTAEEVLPVGMLPDGVYLIRIGTLKGSCSRKLIIR